MEKLFVALLALLFAVSCTVTTVSKPELKQATVVVMQTGADVQVLQVIESDVDIEECSKIKVDKAFKNKSVHKIVIVENDGLYSVINESTLSGPPILPCAPEQTG